jgi:hypothetical protein
MNVPETINRILTAHGGPSRLEWLREHHAAIPTDGDTQKIAYDKDGRNRQKQRTGRFVRQYLWPEVSDIALQAIAAEINVALWAPTSADGLDTYGVQVLTGEAIRECYRTCKATSCMTGHASEYLDLYVDNPDVVALLYVRLPDGDARALLWSGVYVDRVYWSSASAQVAMDQYICARKLDTSRNPGPLKVRIRRGVDSDWPYMDTYTTCDISGNATCTLYADGSGDTSLQETDGACGNSDTLRCEGCNSRLRGDDAYVHEDYAYCEACYDERFSECDKCGDTHANDDLSYYDGVGQTLCEYCADNYYTQCADCNNLCRNDDLTEIDGESYCDDCITTCDECGEAVATCSTTEIDEQRLCKECFDETYIQCAKCGRIVSRKIGCEDCDAENMHSIVLWREIRYPAPVST